MLCSVSYNALRESSGIGKEVDDLFVHFLWALERKARSQALNQWFKMLGLPERAGDELKILHFMFPWTVLLSFALKQIRHHRTPAFHGNLSTRLELIMWTQAIVDNLRGLDGTRQSMGFHATGDIDCVPP